jgi:hypothetical protein
MVNHPQNQQSQPNPAQTIEATRLVLFLSSPHFISNRAKVKGHIATIRSGETPLSPNNHPLQMPIRNAFVQEIQSS